jgi:hypothetical protein
MSDINWPVSADAVLYRVDRKVKEQPEIWHVDDVYHPENGNYPRVHIWDGTHTVDEWWHLEDLQACFEPAGWSTTHKPTYILTRKIGHKAYPRDAMNKHLYQGDSDA